jgi:hypothetical protein
MILILCSVKNFFPLMDRRVLLEGFDKWHHSDVKIINLTVQETLRTNESKIRRRGSTLLDLSSLRPDFDIESLNVFTRYGRKLESR